MKLFDTHTHLDFACFDEDRQAVLTRFQARGGERILLAGVSQSQWAIAAQLCQRHASLCMSVGFHPHFLEPEASVAGAAATERHANNSIRHGRPSLSSLDANQLQRQLADALAHYGDHIVAIGECGLDRMVKTPMAEQLRVLEAQLAFAKQAQLPVILHCRGAHNELLQCLSQQGVHSGVIHAFSGSVELAQEYIRRGLKIGVGGTISYARAAKTRRAIAQLPLTELLLETDSPDMPHEGFQGQRNEPAHCADTITHLAQLRDEDDATIASQLWQNALSLFGRKL